MMNINWSEQFRKFFQLHVPESPGKVKQGLYPFRREAGGSVTRFHLRVEEDGSGLLLANSSVGARLSSSGVIIAKALLEGNTVEQIRQNIRKSFRGFKENQLQEDIARLNQFIETLANPEDNYPIFNLDDPALGAPRRLFAPFHAQLLVASSEKTNPLLQKLWDNGIAHVTFQAKRTSLPEEAVLNVERAEDLGMISGLRGVAGWMQTPDLLYRAGMAGVDYVVVPLLFSEQEKHDAWLESGDFEKALQFFADCRKWEICPVVEIPLFKKNLDELQDLTMFLESNGVRNVLYYAIASEFQELGLSGTEIIQVAVDVEELAHTSLVRYVWQPPVSTKRDLRDILEAGPRSAGDISVRVDPDGSVYPARGPLVAAGNLLIDDWQRIWNHEVFRKYRERVESPTHCDICPGLEICAADCPAEPQGWAGDEG